MSETTFGGNEKDEILDPEGQDTNPDLIAKLRLLVHRYRDRHCYKTALFWADKVASLSKYEAEDVYNLTQCMFCTGEYERAAIFIRKRGLHEKFNAFRYLAAKCYAECKDWQSALELLEDSSCEIVSKSVIMESDNVPGVPTNKEMEAAILLLKGDIYEARETRQLAAQCFEEALRADSFCYEAYDRLISHQLLNPSGEQELLDSLPLEEHCKSKEEKELITFLYGTKIKKYTKPLDFEVPSSLDHLHENLEIAAALAERHYYNCEFKSSYKITSGILKCDPYHPQCLPLHIVLLVVFKKSNELFYLSHKLVKLYPGDAISWFAIGCYYLLQPKNQELTRRYLLKATMLDKMYGPAWLALGHSFAMEGEHDQAMAAYFTATQLMKGSHLPYLYSGMEYSVTNNITLTEKFFSVALAICPDDPHTLHEIGVASYSMSNYPAALKYFNKALDLLMKSQDEITAEEWEALLNNLGHVHRKMKNYELALDFHQQALVLAPQCAQTYSSIGFVLTSMGKYSEALEYLHKALGLCRDDVFAVNLIEHVMNRYAEVEPPLSDGDMVLEDDNGPPPLSHTAGGKHQYDASTKVDHVQEMQGSVTVGGDVETPSQVDERRAISKANVLAEDIEVFKTPEEMLLGRTQPPTIRATKKFPTKTRRVISSPIPYIPTMGEQAMFLDPSHKAGATVAQESTTNTLPVLRSESSDDGGPIGEGLLPRGDERTKLPSTGLSEGEWSTVVLKGGGEAFGPSHADIPNVVETEIMMLAEGQPATSISATATPSGVQISGFLDSPGKARTQGCKRSYDDMDSDMDLDDTL